MLDMVKSLLIASNSVHSTFNYRGAIQWDTILGDMGMKDINSKNELINTIKLNKYFGLPSINYTINDADINQINSDTIFIELVNLISNKSVEA